MEKQQKQYKSTTHEERFSHFVLTANEPRGKYQAATVFARKEDDGMWYLSIALCWKEDQFDRARGRKNARRNYFKKRVTHVMGTEWKHEIARNYAIDRANASENYA